jgi:hypothetical protein
MLVSMLSSLVGAAEVATLVYLVLEAVAGVPVGIGLMFLRKPQAVTLPRSLLLI